MQKVVGGANLSCRGQSRGERRYRKKENVERENRRHGKGKRERVTNIRILSNAEKESRTAIGDEYSSK